VVVTVPLTSATHGLIGTAALAAMRPGAVLINVARGGVVDEAALLDALGDGRLAGVALDVFASEPLPADSPLWDHPAVLVTPHVSGFAPRYESDVLDLLVANVERYVRGDPLANRVERPRGY
jgi:phosphoglycerate dehydrogenase-like enzyme